MCPGSRDEPGPQSRDSPLGMLIAPGILWWLVPGSPAIVYLGMDGGFLKRLRDRLEPVGHCL